MDEFYELIEKRVGEFNVMTPGFWSSLAEEELQLAREIGILPNTRQKMERHAKAHANDLLFELEGGYEGSIEAPIRIFARDIFRELKDNELLGPDDKTKFFNAMPLYGSGEHIGYVIAHALRMQQINSLRRLAAHPKAHLILTTISTRIDTFEALDDVEIEGRTPFEYSESNALERIQIPIDDVRRSAQEMFHQEMNRGSWGALWGHEMHKYFAASESYPNIMKISEEILRSA